MDSHSTNMKKNMRQIFWVFFLLFSALIVYLVKLVFVDSKSIVENSLNPRNALYREEIQRGTIYDTNLNVLAETKNGKRVYPKGKAFAHIVGFDTHGQSGVEGKYNLWLNKPGFEVVERFKNVFYGTPLIGDSIVLTVDQDLQEKIVSKLGKQKGAAVVLEATTGKILAVASFPDFDPNNISNNWEKLIKDEKNSPLLNRATQGLYPPGSTFKIITAAAYMKINTDYSDFKYTCDGSEEFGTKTIHCAKHKAHGEEDLHEAFYESCNTFFSTIGMKIGALNLKTMSNKAMFNKNLPIPLPYSRSVFSLNQEALDPELVETAIGQGKTLATPFHMAMITQAVANGGLMMEPYILDYVKTNSGTVEKKNMPKALSQVFTTKESEEIKNMMVAVVENGTGKNVKMDGLKIAGKTGTAENSQGSPHGWFVSFAPADNPKYAVCVLTENTDGPKKAIQITKEIYSTILNLEE